MHKQRKAKLDRIVMEMCLIGYTRKAAMTAIYSGAMTACWEHIMDSAVEELQFAQWCAANDPSILGRYLSPGFTYTIQRVRKNVDAARAHSNRVPPRRNRDLSRPYKFRRYGAGVVRGKVTVGVVTMPVVLTNNGVRFLWTK